MITPSDSRNTYDLGKYYTILPMNPNWNLDLFIKLNGAKKVQEGFSYNSGENIDWETPETLRSLIIQHVDQTI